RARRFSAIRRGVGWALSIQSLYRASGRRRLECRCALGDTGAMRETVRSALVARPPGLLYDLVVDVERYPDFVPGVSSAAVLERSDAAQLARLTVHRGP